MLNNHKLHINNIPSIFTKIISIFYIKTSPVCKKYFHFYGNSFIIKENHSILFAYYFNYFNLLFLINARNELSLLYKTYNDCLDLFLYCNKFNTLPFAFVCNEYYVTDLLMFFNCYQSSIFILCELLDFPCLYLYDDNKIYLLLLNNICSMYYKLNPLLTSNVWNVSYFMDNSLNLIYNHINVY